MTDKEGGEAAEVVTEEAAPGAAVLSQEQDNPRDWVAEAKEYGWVPKEQFRGDPDNWRDAEAFVKRGEEFLPFVQKQNRELKEKLDRIESSHKEEMVRVKRVFDTLSKQQKAELSKLKTERTAAIKSADVEEVERIDQQIESLREAAEPDEDPAAVQSEWISKQDWWETDEDMTAYAIGVSQNILAKNPKISMAENLRQTEEKLKAKYPEKFGGKNKTAAANGHAAVDGGGVFAGAPQRKGNGVENLPAIAKDIGAQLVADGTFKTLKDYADSYWKDNANA